MVADHLTLAECRRVSEGLHSKHVVPNHNFTGKREPNKPCIALLLHWDRNEGRGKSFIDLPLRLKQIGRKDLADRLSKAVYGEETEAVRQKFFNFQFEPYYNKESTMLVRSHNIVVNRRPRGEQNEDMNDDGDDEQPDPVENYAAQTTLNESPDLSYFNNVLYVTAFLCSVILATKLSYMVIMRVGPCRRHYDEFRNSFYLEFVGYAPPQENLYLFV